MENKKRRKSNWNVSTRGSVKGHENFVRAAISICQKRRDVKFLCIGRYHDLKLKNKLTQTIEKNHMSERIIFYEESSNPVDTLCAFDIFCSPSVYGEGFSNVLAEAMSCERICVATDLAESKNILGEFGLLDSVGSVDSLAKKIVIALDLSEEKTMDLGSKARERIMNKFSIESLVNNSMYKFKAILC